MITKTMTRLAAAAAMTMMALSFGFAQEVTKVSTDVATKATVTDPILIGVDAVKSQLDAGVKITILDERGGQQAEMIKGSTQVTLDKVDAWAAGAGSTLAKDAMIVTYCGCGAEQGSKALAAKLQQLGFTNVHALKGGINAWKGAGLPVENPR